MEADEGDPAENLCNLRKEGRQMAATRLIAMHKNKGRSMQQCLKDRTDYAQNGEKTNGGELVSSYACDPKTVEEEFAVSKREYLQKTVSVMQRQCAGQKEDMLLSWQRMWIRHMFIIISSIILRILTVTGNSKTSFSLE